ncbi:MAG: DHHA1 domain-containing protein [Candidatus Woesearchaeota archaeon]|nr:DHHA1 domain-containing protein [Candidatus Woesearchaeota archaeon]
MDYAKIKEELESCTKPLFFFHDDADGICSFLLFYKFIKEGKGIIVKATPRIDSKFIRKVEEYQPDKIFVLDIAMIDDEFIDAVKTKIVMIDHHEPLEKKKIIYFNPRLEGKNVPVTYICYKAAGGDLWLATLGAAADWFYPEYAKEFSEKYPDLLPENIKDPEKIMFETKLGELMKIFSFVIKGDTDNANKCIKILTRINEPYEILDQSTPQGKFIYHQYEKINKEYEELLEEALKTKAEGKTFLCIYKDVKISFTKELSNYFLHKYPEKIIVIGRERSEEVKLSFRASKINVRDVLEKALVGIDGYGGGHEMACGANIKKKDFERFMENFNHFLR